MSFTIIRDTREKEGKGYWFDKVEKSKKKTSAAYTECDGTVSRKLDFGDYSFDGGENFISIERKGSINELYGNFGTAKSRERFMAEVERMKNVPHKYVVIESSLDEILNGSFYSKIHPNCVISQLNSLEMKHGFKIVFAGNAKSAKKYIYNILKKAHEYFVENKNAE